MREIKFKIWSNAGKVFLGSKYTHISADGQSIDCCGDKYNTWDEVTLLQFTGLKDKNGIEMYESDIVKFHYFFQSLGENLGVQESEHELIGVVCYHNFGWGINAIKGEHWQAYTGYNAGEGHSNFLDLMAMNESSIHEESFEIIGNIYENPELLNSDKSVQGSVARTFEITTLEGNHLVTWNDWIGSLKVSAENFTLASPSTTSSRTAVMCLYDNHIWSYSSIDGLIPEGLACTCGMFLWHQEKCECCGNIVNKPQMNNKINQ